MGRMGGLINPRPGGGQYRAGFSNTGASPEPRKRAPCQKRKILDHLQFDLLLDHGKLLYLAQAAYKSPCTTTYNNYYLVECLES